MLRRDPASYSMPTLSPSAIASVLARLGRRGGNVKGVVGLDTRSQHLRFVAPLEGIMVLLQLMSISGKELHVPVLPLHVAERPFLGGVIGTKTRFGVLSPRLNKRVAV